MSAVIQTMVESAIKSNRVMVFAKSYCPYCKSTRDLLTSRAITFNVFDLDLMPEGSAVQDYLLQKTGQKTVPNIFINQIHVGGNSDLVKAAETGRLDELLSKA